MTREKKTPVLQKPLLAYEEKIEWRNFEVNIDRIFEYWDIEVEDLKDFLKKMSIEQVRRISVAFDSRIPDSQILEKILNDPKNVLELIAIMHFMSMNRKTFATVLQLKVKDGRFDEYELVTRIIETRKEHGLHLLFLKYLHVKLGRGSYRFKMHESPTLVQIDNLIEKAKSVSIALGQSNLRDLRYKMRFAFKEGDEAYILLLRELDDKVIPAIPNNKHVITSKYILCYFNFATKECSITTRSKHEAYTIRNYAGRKLGVPVVNNIEDADVDVNYFLERILDVEGNRESGLALHKFDIKASVGDLKITVQGANSVDEVAARIKILKQKEIMRFDDLSAFAGFNFHFRHINYSVRVAEDDWGGQWMHLNTSNKPQVDLRDFTKTFRERFGVEFGKRIRGSMNERSIAKKILDKHRKIQVPLPPQVESVFLNLIEKKLVKPPTKSSKRKCLECSRVSWVTEECPHCGGDMYILGNYLEVAHDRISCEKFLLNLLKKNLQHVGKISKRQRTIEDKRREFYVLEQTNGNEIWFYLSLGESVADIQKLFKFTGNVLICVFLKHGENHLSALWDNEIPCFEVLDFIYDEKHWQKIEGKIESLPRDLTTRRKRAAKASYDRLRDKHAKYDDQDFEQDIYNVLHEVFGVADRLGGKFAGVPAPDGVAAINNKMTGRSKKLSLAWDCKFSELKNGYQIKDDILKHRHYLSSLSKNRDIRRFGKFKIYLIISQNMNLKMYEKFQTNVVTGFKSWKGKMIFFSEDAVLEIYRLYAKYFNHIEDRPEKFYSALYKMFAKVKQRDSLPFPNISEELLGEFSEQLQNEYAEASRKIKLERGDFQKYGTESRYDMVAERKKRYRNKKNN